MLNIMQFTLILAFLFSSLAKAQHRFIPNGLNHFNQFQWYDQLMIQKNDKDNSDKFQSVKKRKSKKKDKSKIKIELGFIQVENFNNRDNCMSLSTNERRQVEESINQNQNNFSAYPFMSPNAEDCRDQIIARSLTPSDTEIRQKLINSMVDRWFLRNLEGALKQSSKKTFTLNSSITNQGFDVIGYLPALDESFHIEDEETNINAGAILIVAKFQGKNFSVIGQRGELKIKSKDSMIELSCFMGALTTYGNDLKKLKTSTFFQESKSLTSGLSLSRYLGRISGKMSGKLNDQINFVSSGNATVGVLNGSNLMAYGEVGFESNEKKDSAHVTFIKIKTLQNFLSPQNEKNPLNGTKIKTARLLFLGSKDRLQSGQISLEYQLTLFQEIDDHIQGAIGELNLGLKPSRYFSFNLGGKGAVTRTSINPVDFKFWGKANIDSKIKLSDSGFALTGYAFTQSGLTAFYMGEGSFIDDRALPKEMQGPYYQVGLMLEYDFSNN